MHPLSIAFKIGKKDTPMNNGDIIL